MTDIKTRCREYSRLVNTIRDLEIILENTHKALDKERIAQKLMEKDLGLELSKLGKLVVADDKAFEGTNNGHNCYVFIKDVLE